MLHEIGTASNSEVFQLGSRFGEIVSDAICLNGKDRIMKIETDIAKKKIIEFMKTKDSFYISDLAEELSLKPSIVVKAVKELKMEGKIRDDE